MPYGSYQSVEECQEEVGPGWADIVRRCWEAAEAAGAQVVQVKEKFGGLRFYCSPHVEAVEALEGESYKTCEFCGQPGKVSREYPEDIVVYWAKCRCDNCAEKYIEGTRAGKRPYEIDYTGETV